MLDSSLLTAADAGVSPANQKTSRRERRKLEVRRKLYVAALDLFEKQGYENTTVQNICDAADTARQTFFNYFPGKEHLLAAYHANLVRSIFEQISKDTSSSPSGSILSAMRIFAAAVERSASLSRTILRHVFSSDVLESVDEQNEKLIHSWFYEKLIQSVRSGEIQRGLNLKILTSVMISILSSTVQEWIVSTDRFDLGKELTARIRFLLHLCGTAR